MEKKYIELVLKEAEKAYNSGEVPVGAVIIKNNKIIAKAHNMVEKKKNSIMHAEIIAITKASKKIRNWRLNNCDMYVSLEPCDMCKAAILLSRINKVYYLVKKDNLKLLVNVKNWTLEVIELPNNTNERKFVYGKNKFINCGKLKMK